MSKITQYKKWLADKLSRRIQNKYDFSNLKNAKKAIVFLVPGNTKINGGVMSIFSLCRFSRELNPTSYCCLCTYPYKVTYAHNNMFPNNEFITRFELFIKNAQQLQELIIHIPEYYASSFYNDLTPEDITFLKKISKLQINIMNQNIQLMPHPETLQNLRLLTQNITQTMAHHRYATQQICEQWHIPTHLFSVYIPIEEYAKHPFEKKQKTIVLSPDDPPYRENIVKRLKKHLKGWKLITVKKLTFSQYMDLISKSFFSITFGEGFDGYFTQPCRIGSLAFAIYNDDFFPSSEWKQLPNVYTSSKEMEEKIISDILYFSTHKEEFLQAAQNTADLRGKIYSKEKFLDNLRRFYQQEYDFYPKQK